MPIKSNHSIVTFQTCLFSLIFGLLICLGIFFYIGFSGWETVKNKENAVAQLTIIPASTFIATVVSSIDESPNLEVRYVSPEGFTIGAFVQITNTQGAGLKVRSESGTDGEATFIGKDGDLFTIIDGPDDKNGYSWWKLQSVEDAQSTGWAAADYLSLAAPAADQRY